MELENNGFFKSIYRPWEYQWEYMGIRGNTWEYVYSQGFLRQVGIHGRPSGNALTKRPKKVSLVTVIFYTFFCQIITSYQYVKCLVGDLKIQLMPVRAWIERFERGAL